jgi:N-methylhydantoinase A/oxoprolinase/acetone carboxylase beta subunit
VIENGQVTVTEEGATVGDYKTSVQAANILSIALGGDSHIHLDDVKKRLVLGPARVVPLAYLAHQYPGVKRRLEPLLQRGLGQVGQDQLQFWFLLREPREGMVAAGSREAQVVELLRDGPMAVADIVRRLNLVHSVQIGCTELWRQEILGRAGLTPTDFLHIQGEYTAWDAEMSRIGATLFCHSLSTDVDTFAPALWERIAATITEVILSFLTKKRLAAPDATKDVDMGRWFFDNSLSQAHPHLETTLHLKSPIIGIGAPAGFFLQRVAEIFHTDLILPRYHEVANAVGAVAGNVMVSEEALVYPRLTEDGVDIAGYIVQTSEDRRFVETLADALQHARQRVRELSWEGAVRSGASNPQVTLQESDDGLDSYRIRARAIGNPRLA